MNSPSAQILFAAAKSRIDVILELVSEFNDISQTLKSLGYGASDEDLQRGNSDESPTPTLSVSANTVGWTMVEDASILDEYFVRRTH